VELEKEFLYSQYVTIPRKAELSVSIGLSDRQVKIWFQNRRAKERKHKKRSHDDVTKPSRVSEGQKQVDTQLRHETERGGRGAQQDAVISKATIKLEVDPSNAVGQQMQQSRSTTLVPPSLQLC